jgi:hypothetical protein
MKFAFEIHKYAPELNTVHILNKHGKPCGHFKPMDSLFEMTTQATRKARFAPIKPRIHATVKKEYPAPWQKLNRQYSGGVDTRLQAVQFAQRIRANEQGGVLFDGRTLPKPKVTVVTRLIG